MASAMRRRILVAEDNDSARMILADLCRVLGYDVDEVAYDVVLMDCQMPVLGGLDATRAIRACEGTRRTVIIAVTGDGDRDACRAAGMDDYLAKPVRPQQLRAALARWLGVDAPTSRSETSSPRTSQTPP